MRLLERKPDGSLILREFIGSAVPAYAILSHTWGKEEVSFQEVDAGTGKDKAGWRKIEFCAKQAGADGLRYIWVDTCCIDKRNVVELSEAINSMFRWYQKAARCYVYLRCLNRWTVWSIKPCIDGGFQGESMVHSGLDASRTDYIDVG
jgi:hypothetical protein